MGDCGNNSIQKPISRDRMDSPESSFDSSPKKSSDTTLASFGTSKLPTNPHAPKQSSVPQSPKSPSVSHQLSHCGGPEANALRHGQGQSPQGTWGLRSVLGTTLQRAFSRTDARLGMIKIYMNRNDKDLHKFKFFRQNELYESANKYPAPGYASWLG